MCEKLNPAQKQECNNGEGCCVFRRPDGVPSFDKGGHKESSIANSPVHRKHWQKVNNQNRIEVQKKKEAKNASK